MKIRRVPIPRTQMTNPPKQTWFERNQGLIQFLLLVCTIAALAITFYFSSRNAEDTKKSLDIAAEQTKQNQHVFNYTKSLDSLRNISESEKDSLQRLLNEKQLALNEQQNVFISGQLKSQLIQLQRQNEVEKPNISLSSVDLESYDSLRRVVNATVKNTSKRTAHILKIISASYCRSTLLALANTNYNFDMPESGTHSNAFLLHEDIIADSTTLFYLKFFYRDLDHKILTKEFYFQAYGYSYPKTYFLPVSDEVILDFQSHLKRTILNYEQVLNDPFYKQKHRLK